MGLEATGTIFKLFDAKQITERFKKREFVVQMTEGNPEYPQYVLFQLTGDRCATLDEFQQGDEVRVEFSLRGREWTSPTNEVKYFNSLDVWTVQKLNGSAGGGGGGGGAKEDSGFSDEGEEPPF
ncbi:MAG: DUF3127 domain-containing protein [Candidatus Binatia bacterium]|nr:DUF3127 domain-containing protein [Candidatus Binatia bacterium]